MDELIRQIRVASDAGLYYLALLGTLSLPDMCGALASTDGKASGSKYKDWLRDNVPEQSGSADLIYGLRCSLLHQGRALPHGSIFPVAFTFPTANSGDVHNCEIQVGNDQVAVFSIPVFVAEVTGGAETWLREYGATNTVTRNLEKFARLRTELPPFFHGPIIA